MRQSIRRWTCYQHLVPADTAELNLQANLDVMVDLDIILLSVTAALIAFLLFRHWLGFRRHPPEPLRAGHGIDVTGIADRVQQVRGDFASQLRIRRPDMHYRKSLLALATNGVRRLAYFRRRDLGSSHSSHDLETHTL